MPARFAEIVPPRRDIRLHACQSFKGLRGPRVVARLLLRHAKLAPSAPGVSYYKVRAVDGSNASADANLVEKSAMPTGAISLSTFADTFEGDDRAPSPEAAVIESLTNERLMAAVRQLGDEQRECVLLRFIQGFSVSETAAVMGKNDGAIKALQHRAVRKLAELVGGELR